jgi:hypothetical protein
MDRSFPNADGQFITEGKRQRDDVDILLTMVRGKVVMRDGKVIRARLEKIRYTKNYFLKL